MPVIAKENLINLQRKLTSIRNICILAHVDHGKTTLADSLVASNGIISQRMAGKLRYMDSRTDEQERGITMKSSSISLLFSEPTTNEDFIVNLIDSPGHVDFSSEVSTAVRLCDGAIILVDVVEGVCPQTRICLKQAYIEKLKPILVLNKIDRLILEKKLTPLDAYVHISQVLEQVNATVGNIFASDVMSKEVKTNQNDHVSALEDSDDSTLYFAPEAGNVIFSSAVDGWAFRLQDFAEMYADKLNISVNELANVLWGDYYYSTKTKSYAKGAQEKAKKPMFVQFILENIWNLYDVIAVRKDREKVPAIAEKLGVKLNSRDLRQTDPKVQIQAIFSQWLPLERAVLEQVVRLCPHPGLISDEKATQLMCSLNQDFDTLPKQTQALKSEFMASNASSDTVIVFISKMFSVNRSLLPENKPKPLTREELVRKRELAQQRIQQRQLELEAKMSDVTLNAGDDVKTAKVSTQAKKVDSVDAEEQQPENVEETDEFIAFARVYSGTLRKGAKIFALTPKHDPNTIVNIADPTTSPHISEVSIENLYLLMGKELDELDEAPAGNIIGIRGLQHHVLKTATLSSTAFCPSFCDLTIMTTPIFRVAVEPKYPTDMQRLIKGLKLLNQADACVQILVQENGEHVLVTLGEVHLERCIYDLENQYAKCALTVSSPIVPMRETIVPQAKLDMVNEAIVTSADEKNADKSVTIFTANKQCRIKLIALPLPKAVVDRLEENANALKSASQLTVQTISDRTRTKLNELRVALANDFKSAEDCDNIYHQDDFIDRIWAFGPKKCGPNMLVNLTDLRHQSVWQNFGVDSESQCTKDKDARQDLISSFLNGYQFATLAGPLCEEPMQGVCFVVQEWQFDANESENIVTISGQIISAMKDGCRKAFQKQSPRIVTPMYSCNIVVSNEVLGKLEHNSLDIVDEKAPYGNLLVYVFIKNIIEYVKKGTGFIY